MSWSTRQDASDRWTNRIWLAAKILAALCAITPIALIAAAIIFDEPYRCPQDQVLCLEDYDIKGSSDAASALRRTLVRRIEDGASAEELVLLLTSAGMACGAGPEDPRVTSCQYQAKRSWTRPLSFPVYWHVEVRHSQVANGHPDLGAVQYRILAP